MRTTFVSAAPARDRSRLTEALGNLSWSLVSSALALSVVGVFLVHSASEELQTSYMPRQIAWIVLGLGVMMLAYLVDYHLLLRFSPQLYVAGIGAVVLVLLFGHEAGGARSWVGLFGLGGQPSDFAKIATALVLARALAAVRLEFLELRHLIGAGVLVTLPVVTIALQPDYGGAAMFLPLVVGMIWAAGVRPRLLVIGLALSLVIGPSLWFFAMKDYQKERILTFVQPERDPLGAGYQVRQSKIAVGSGAVVGKGYLQGTQSQLRFLPARHTDFVFAVLAEEQGFVGVLVTLALYALYFRSGVRIASRARDRAGILLAAGLLAALAAYVLYNTAMVIGLVPVTGIPLPFLSYGGSFMLFCFFATGLLLSIDSRRYVNR